jgi:hypothetical protein
MMRGSRYLVNDKFLFRGRCWLERIFVDDIAGNNVQQGCCRGGSENALGHLLGCDHDVIMFA